MLEFRLELLMVKFESMRMSEEETVINFNGRLCNKANESLLLGK